MQFLISLGFKNIVGIDINANMVDECVNVHKLPAKKADALDFFAALPDASVAMITGFHIVEHLNPGILRSLMKQVVRVLHPGGICIFETPNPENLLTASQYFFLDPTHIRPLPPDLLVLYVEHAGLLVRDVSRLQPNTDLGYVSGSIPDGHPDQTVNLILNHFRACRDYAVISERP